MSEILSNPMPIENVNSPSLVPVEFASGLDNAFQNINDNFARLANTNFIKGDRGESVTIEPVKFFINGSGKLTQFGKLLKQCILNMNDVNNDVNTDDTLEPLADDTIKSIGPEIDFENIDDTLTDEFAPIIIDENHKLGLFDNFNKNRDKSINYEPQDSVYMIYNAPNDNSTRVPISSMYYVFLDGRYVNNLIGKFDDDTYNGQYTNIDDKSCIVVYNGEKCCFEKLDNAFPTIYYEKGVGLCWRINGNPTGIPVRGLPGKDGMNSKLHIVKCNPINIDDDTDAIRAEVASIFNTYDGYLPLPEDVADYDGHSSLILITDINSDKVSFYFGYLSVEDGKLYAYCDTTTSINVGVDEEAFLNAMKSISLMDNADSISLIKGLFIPMKVNGTNKPVHLLSASSIENKEGDNLDGLRADLLITPVNDINSLEVNDNKKLQIDKYLYLRVKENLYDEVPVVVGQDIPAALSKDNYVIKYKLDSIVYNCGDINNDRYFGSAYTGDGDTFVELNDNSYKYYNIYDHKTSNDHRVSIPKEFGKRLNDWNIIPNNTGKHIGIYKWVQCTDNHDFDVTDLKSGSNRTPVKQLRVIFTTTINPSVNSEIMWFNGMQIASETDFTTPEYSVPSGSYLFGWSRGNNESPFEFVKFIPVYNNSFVVDEDSALNINYDVNITGNADGNPNRSITINGSVNCNDLSVYSLTATKEIKNIFTREDIVSEGGIKLGKTSDNEYSTVIDSTGKITTTNTISAPTVECDNANITGSMISHGVESNNLQINNTKGGRQLFVGNDSKTDKATFELINIEKVNINRKIDDTKLGTTEAQPVFSNELTTLQHNNSNIIVSNQGEGSHQLCYYGVAANVKDAADAGTGVYGDSAQQSNNAYISNPDFDYVKNFNIHRLAIESNGATSVNIVDSVKNNNTAFINNNAHTLEIAKNTFSQTDNAKLSSKFTNTFANKSIEILTIGARKAGIDKTIRFNRSQPIRIEFDSNIDYLTYIGVQGKCTNSRRPHLHSESNMTLKLHCKIGNEYIELASKGSYTFDYTASSTKSAASWYGYNTDGKYLTHVNYAWRYYPYAFHPSAFVINPDSNPESNYNKIADAFDDGVDITFYVFPEFNLRVRGQTIINDPKSVIKGIEIHSFIPIKKTGLITPGSTVIKNLGTTNTSNNAYAKMWKGNTPQQSCSISYTVNEIPNGTDNTKVTTICKDGVVVRSGNVVFGLGAGNAVYDHDKNGYNVNNVTDDYTWKPQGSVDGNYLENEPVLFYYDGNENDKYYDGNGKPKGNSSGGTSLKGYSSRTHAIPIKDIFEVIKFMRELKDLDVVNYIKNQKENSANKS